MAREAGVDNPAGRRRDAGSRGLREGVVRGSRRGARPVGRPWRRSAQRPAGQQADEPDELQGGKGLGQLGQGHRGARLRHPVARGPGQLRLSGPREGLEGGQEKPDRSRQPPARRLRQAGGGLRGTRGGLRQLSAADAARAPGSCARGRRTAHSRGLAPDLRRSRDRTPPGAPGRAWRATRGAVARALSGRPDRRVPGHRPAPGADLRAHLRSVRPRSRRRRRRGRRPAVEPVHRRRPQAVHLPVSRRRRLRLSVGAPESRQDPAARQQLARGARSRRRAQRPVRRFPVLRPARDRLRGGASGAKGSRTSRRGRPGATVQDRRVRRRGEQVEGPSANRAGDGGADRPAAASRRAGRGPARRRAAAGFGHRRPRAHPRPGPASRRGVARPQCPQRRDRRRQRVRDPRVGADAAPSRRARPTGSRRPGAGGAGRRRLRSRQRAAARSRPGRRGLGGPARKAGRVARALAIEGRRHGAVASPRCRRRRPRAAALPRRPAPADEFPAPGRAPERSGNGEPVHARGPRGLAAPAARTAAAGRRQHPAQDRERRGPGQGADGAWRQGPGVSGGVLSLRLGRRSGSRAA